MTPQEMMVKWRAKKLDYFEASAETANDTMAMVLRAKSQVCDQVLADLLLVIEEASDDGR